MTRCRSSPAHRPVKPGAWPCSCPRPACSTAGYTSATPARGRALGRFAGTQVHLTTTSSSTPARPLPPGAMIVPMLIESCSSRKQTLVVDIKLADGASFHTTCRQYRTPKKPWVKHWTHARATPTQNHLRSLLTCTRSGAWRTVPPRPTVPERHA